MLGSTDGGMLDVIVIGRQRRFNFSCLAGSAFFSATAIQVFGCGFNSNLATSFLLTLGKADRRAPLHMLTELGQTLLLVRPRGKLLDLGTRRGTQLEPGLEPMGRLDRQDRAEVDQPARTAGLSPRSDWSAPRPRNRVISRIRSPGGVEFSSVRWDSLRP